MKRRKLFSLFLAAVMVFSLPGCGSSEDSTSEGSQTVSEAENVEASTGTETVETEEADPFGKYEETLEIHFVRSTDDTIETNVLANLPGQTLEDNFWLDTYEEELGIKVVYDWIVKGDDEFNQKMNVSMASGELPDVMCVTATQMQQLIDAGLVQEMGSVYDAYAADFTKEVMSQEGDAPFLAGIKDGVQ